MRKEFKKVNIKNSTYLYPFPVVKDHKYLISIDESFAPFFILSWRNEYLALPDEKPSYLDFLDFHSDKQTCIYTINADKLNFYFLNEDTARTNKIHEILSKKIRAVLNKEDHARDNLQKAFEKQMKCQTCIDLGIKSPEVINWISSLVDIRRA